MLDLDLLVASNTAKVFIRHPVTGEPTEGWFEVYGHASQEYRRVRNQVMADRIAEGEKLSEEKAEEFNNRLLLGALKDMGGLTYKKKEYKHSPENAKTLLETPGYHWLKAQVDDAIVNVGNFLKG